MISSKYVRNSSLALICSLATVGAQAREKAIDRSALPPAVERAVQKQSAGATVKGFTTELEHGKTSYEAAMVVDGHTKDVEFAPDGSVNEVEEEVAFDTLPPKVQTSLKTRSAAAKITKVESLTKGGKLVAYEAATLSGAKKGEIQVGPDGEKLSHEE